VALATSYLGRRWEDPGLPKISSPREHSLFGTEHVGSGSPAIAGELPMGFFVDLDR
jgi:hypothetical protein